MLSTPFGFPEDMVHCSVLALEIYFVKVARFYITAFLKWIRHLAKNLRKVLTELWKDKKLRKVWSNSSFKLKQMNHTNYRNKEHEISNRLYSGLGVIPETSDEIYVSISIGKYIITFHLFSALCERSYCCWKYRKWGSYLKNRYHYATMIENAKTNFSISPCCTLQQLTFALLVSFLLNLNTFHTLLWCYYSHFEKANVGWECTVNFLSK